MIAYIRIFIGSILLASGIEKILSPYQNFQYVIQAYEFLPTDLEKLAALVVPWIELFVGLFLVIGLWIDLALKGALLLFGCFIVIVGQALLRGLPIDQCGCFGEMIHIKPQFIVVFDSLILLLIVYLINNPTAVTRLSLDKKTFS